MTSIFRTSKMSTMLEYAKIILKNVSFDKKLFEKELFKLSADMCSAELLALYIWLNDIFGDKYPESINSFIVRYGFNDLA